MPPPPPPAAEIVVSGNPPQDYMTLAIIATILGICFGWCIGLVLGIIAIVFASKSRSAWAAGDVATAYSAANTAKILTYIAFALAALGLIIWIIALATGSFRVGG